jgi:histidine triad (HIT) family protein
VSDCLFCKIIKKEIPAKVAYEDERVLAFHDINPQAPVHLLIIPKKHIAMIADLEEADIAVSGALIHAAKKIARETGCADYRLIFNNGRGVGQSVFHIHLHLMAGRSMGWPPG